MGAGLAQIGVLMVLTVIGLPLFFFGLMAALDHFEKSLSASPRTVDPASPVSAKPLVAIDEPDAEVLTLPTTSMVAPAAATSATAAGAKPAAAI